MNKLCIRCGENQAVLSRTGRQRLLCASCKKLSRSVRLNQHRQAKLAHKKLHCEHCGFVALHPCQLDVDHIDGNRDNDSPSNFRTLCANCHRLKTHTERDHVWSEQEAEPTPQLKLVV